ncbi:MAG: MFS transporter [Rhizorhabdus sp.]
MTGSSAGKRDTEWQDGWRPLVASTVGFGTGLGLVTYLSGLFIVPMQAESGWSISAVTISPIISLLVGLCSPLAGMMVDRWGSRPVGLTGLAMLGVSLCVLAAAPLHPWTLYGAAAGIGLVGALSSTTPFLRCVVSWFRQRTGLALGLAMNGVPVMAFLVTPVVSWVIYEHGWRAGYLALAAVSLLVGWPLVYMLLAERPDAQPRAREAGATTLRKVLRQPAFWLVTAAISLASIPLGGFLANLQPMLAKSGLTIRDATALGMVYAASIMIGRLAGGYCMDRFWDGAVALGLMLLSGIGALMLAGLTADMPMAVLIVAVLLVGMGQGAEADMIGYFALRLFGMAAYSTIVGAWTMAASLFLALGGICFARIYDLSGSYAPACLLGAACFAASGVVLFGTRLVYRQDSGLAALTPI